MDGCSNYVPIIYSKYEFFVGVAMAKLIAWIRVMKLAVQMSHAHLIVSNVAMGNALTLNGDAIVRLSY